MIPTYIQTEKPPILLAQREAAFTCAECGRPGWGPPNSIVHSGRCRNLRTKKLAERATEKRKAAAERRNARAGVSHDERPEVRAY